jgi:hypothetical protein
MKAHRTIGGILNLGSKMWSMVTFTLQPSYPRYPPAMRLSGHEGDLYKITMKKSRLYWVSSPLQKDQSWLHRKYKKI